MKIEELMTPDPITVGPRATAAEAIELFRTNRVRHLPVVDSLGGLAGILSERDVHGLVDEDLTMRVDELMTEKVHTVSSDTAAHEAAYLILRHAIGCVLVTDERDRLLGIITDSDFVRVAYTLLGGAVPVDEIEAEEREADSV